MPPLFKQQQRQEASPDSSPRSGSRGPAYTTVALPTLPSLAVRNAIDAPRVIGDFKARSRPIDDSEGFDRVYRASEDDDDENVALVDELLGRALPVA